MNNTIIIALFQEHCNNCWYKDILKLVKDENACKFCYQVNRDISILLSRLEGARKTIDVGIALPDSSKLNEYLPYEKAGFKLFTNTGSELNDRIRRILYDTFELGYKFVILVSHSTPDIPPIYIKEAINQLKGGKELVFGPLKNGGLYLIGMSKKFYNSYKNNGIFKIINFDTKKITAVMIFLFKKHYFHYFFLPRWNQLKKKQDFKRLTYGLYHSDIAWNATWTRQIIKKYMNQQKGPLK